MPKINGRFYIVKSEDGGWDTADDKYGMTNLLKKENIHNYDINYYFQ